MAKTPVTMLSGFLGAGKTSLLRYLLENSTEKIACIVNDVASVNIDAKLVRNDRNRARGEAVNTTADLADTIELANGCACCNLQDELFASFEQVLALADRRGEPYARIVLENSGVAEPQAIRDKFVEAAAAGHPVTARIELDSLVTLVDAGTFIQDYASRAPLAARPELGEGGNLRPVVDLLVEQVECADFVVLNKVDLLPKDDGGSTAAALGQLVAIVSTLNPLATVIPAQQGQVDIQKVFGANAQRLVARLNVEGQHRGAVAAARTAAAEAANANGDGSDAAGRKRPHDHDAGAAEACEVEGCDHKHHKHAGEEGTGHHDHHHHHHHATKHEDGHKHDHGDGHSHDHSHSHGQGHSDSHHDHDHTGDDCAVCAPAAPAGSAGKAHAETRAAERFGIRSFVYSRRRPFHPQRLRDLVLRWLPVTDNRALEGAAPELGDSPVKAVLRSKGFAWLSSSHASAYYWSHAGQHFEIRDEGDWWTAVADDEWPSDPAQRGVILSDFAQGWGDRRQEIVFIGVAMDEAKICEQLDGALLTEEEMGKYAEKWMQQPDPVHAGAP